MKLATIFNDDVAYDLRLSNDDTYVLGYLYKTCALTEDKKIIDNNECFTFNLTDMFISRKRVFEQVPQIDDLEEDAVKKIYEANRKKFDRMLKKALGKVIVRVKNVKEKGGSKTYYRFNRDVLRALIDGYPTKTSDDFTDKEKMVMKELDMNNLSKGVSTQLKSMKDEVLNEAMKVAKKNNILTFAYVKAVYNNLMQNKTAASATNTNDHQTKNLNFDTNIIPNNHSKYNVKNNQYKKTAFHNFNETFTQYSETDLEAIIERSQLAKFG